MKTILEYLSPYAFYHQHRKNIVTHFIGSPMILVAITVLLSHPKFSVFGIELTPVLITAMISEMFYLFLDEVVGLLMVFLIGLSLYLSSYITSQEIVVWLSIGIGLFVTGWIIQLIVHYLEGKKPAFIDGIIGLVIGSLFVVVEVLFLLGVKRYWKQEIHAFCKQKNKYEGLEK
ncbi:Mpo1-like protein [Marinomonas sp. 5E14-1]|uniref:Mpo1 family 2-hydroxy fatty acid dioxygenase n=1 Tax=Marinomonas sp. 5E14-1 TaxID=3153922 RepID=UPI003267BB54